MAVTEKAAELRRRFGGPTAGNTAWGVAVEVGQLVLSMVLFFGLFLVLEKSDFGAYSALLGIGVIAGNFGQIGSMTLLVRRIAVGEDASSTFSRTLMTILVGCAVMMTLVLGVYRPLFIPDIALSTLGLVIWSQMPPFWVAEATISLGQARRDLKSSAMCRLVYMAVRVLGVLAFVAVGDGTLAQWAVYAAISSSVGAVLTLAFALRRFELGLQWMPPALIDLREGFPYTLNNASADLLDGADRILLVQSGYRVDAADYAAGYRIAAIAWMPIMALVRATDADFFAAGARSAREAALLARKYGRIAAAYGITAGVSLAVFAPTLPVVFGDRFDQPANVIQVLAVLPLLKGLQVFPANALTGSDRNEIRLALLFVTMMMNIILNIIVIPQYSWKGAIATTLICETFLMISFWVAAESIGRKAATTA